LTRTDSSAPATGPATTTRTRPDVADSEGDAADHLRHIICVDCYPAFQGSLEAPHDAVCICGKPVLKGDKPKPSRAPQCILCNELRDHHSATLHSHS
jgi:hypothetical protein